MIEDTPRTVSDRLLSNSWTTGNGSHQVKYVGMGRLELPTPCSQI